MSRNSLVSLRPEVGEAARGWVTVPGIDPPWEHAILTASDLSSATAWSPVEAAAVAGGEKKLWLPGS